MNTMSLSFVACVAAFACVACNGSGSSMQMAAPAVAGSTNIVRLDLGNAAGNDDDPTLVRALDGSYYLVYLSDRSGNKELWATRSVDGTHWSGPVQVTRDPAEDLFPTLLQTSDGMFHLCWGRFAPAAGGTQHIYYARSPDALRFAEAQQVAVTDGAVGDRVTGMNAVGASELRLYFSSAQRAPASKTAYNEDLFVVRSPDRGQSWGSPLRLASASSDAEEDRFPSVVQTDPTSFFLTFNRQRTPAIFDATSDVYLATSTDGLAWGEPQQLTADAADRIHDLWPALIFATAVQRWYVAWTSTTFTTGGLVALPIDAPVAANVVDLQRERHLGGWSLRVAGSVAIWVNNSTGTSQLWAAIDAF